MLSEAFRFVNKLLELVPIILKAAKRRKLKAIRKALLTISFTPGNGGILRELKAFEQRQNERNLKSLEKSVSRTAEPVGKALRKLTSELAGLPIQLAHSLSELEPYKGSLRNAIEIKVILPFRDSAVDASARDHALRLVRNLIEDISEFNRRIIELDSALDSQIT